MLPSENEDNALQIKEKSTERTTPFFVLEVTARSAWTKAISADVARADVVAVRLEKLLSSAF